MRKSNYYRLFAAATLLLLSSCVGTQAFRKSLENMGALKTEESNDPSYDYKVTIKNTIDFGYNGDLKEDRQKVLDSKFKDLCATVVIVDEKMTTVGSYAFNRPMNYYEIKIKCNKITEELGAHD